MGHIAGRNPLFSTANDKAPVTPAFLQQPCSWLEFALGGSEREQLHKFFLLKIINILKILTSFVPNIILLFQIHTCVPPKVALQT